MNDSSQSAKKSNTLHTESSPAPPPKWGDWGWPRARAEASRLNAGMRQIASELWRSPHGQRLRGAVLSGRQAPYSGVAMAVGGVATVTLLIALMERILPAPNPGVL